MSEPNLHAVVGLGAVGRAVTNDLVGRGLAVRAIARHAVAGLPREVDLVQADITDPDAARRAVAGAAVVYHAASAPYHRWPDLLPPLMRGVLEGAASTGARVVYADNLYAYGPVGEPLTEDLPARAAGPNGRVRANLADQLMSAHAAGTVHAAIGRASDFYGPWGRQSMAGERLFDPALVGKTTRVLGDPDLPHTFTYLGDFARGLVTLGTNHPAFGLMPSALLTVLAMVNPTLRAVREQQYQREAPWVVDHSKFVRAFGLDVTPHRDAIEVTLEWYRSDRS